MKRNTLLVFIYPFFFLISLIVPRTKNIWVFGNQKKYFDNTRYFFEYVSKNSGDINAYWLANNLEERNSIIEYGYNSVLKKSFKGFWLSSRAGFSFVCNGFTDVNRLLSLRSNVITFWHGTPIKKIYLDSKQDLKKLGSNKFSIFISSLVLRLLNKNISFYYASNEFERVKVTRAAAINSARSLSLGVPRFDYMRTAEPSKKIIEKIKGRQVFLFAPTWRKGDCWSDGHVINDQEYKRLNSFLEKNKVLFLVKLHPLTDKKIFLRLGLKPSRNIVYADDCGADDINGLYVISDLLISDLSSAIIDFCVFNKPVKIFMPDYEEYIGGDRGVYEEFVELLEKDSIITWSDLVHSLSSDMKLSSGLIKSISVSSSSKKEVCKSILNDLMRRF